MTKGLSHQEAVPLKYLSHGDLIRFAYFGIVLFGSI